MLCHCQHLCPRPLQGPPLYRLLLSSSKSSFPIKLVWCCLRQHATMCSMKAAPTPIFISLGSGNKVTDSDIDRWPLLASHVHNYTSSVCFFPRCQAAQGFSEYCSGGSSFNIHYNTLFIMHVGQCYPFTLNIHPVMHYHCCGFSWDCGMLTQCFTRNT